MKCYLINTYCINKNMYIVIGFGRIWTCLLISSYREGPRPVPMVARGRVPSAQLRIRCRPTINKCVRHVF